MTFRDEHTFEKRQTEAARMRMKYTDRVPIIVEKAAGSEIPDIDKKKFLVPKNLTIGQFIYVVRKRIQLTAEQALFIFVNNSLPATASLVSQVDIEHKSKCGFLYMTYSGESTFG
jgi:GABA(A) receptor-associated protein